MLIKITVVTGLVTSAVLNIKFCEVKNKMPVVSNLVKKKHDAKILEIEKKYITTSDYNRFMSDILDA